VERVVIAAAVVAVAVVVAIVAERRRPAPPTQARWQVPAQLDRADFARADAPWLVVVFTSATCDACAAVREKAVVLESASVAVQEVEHGVSRALHERYHVEAVPMTVVADADGVVLEARDDGHGVRRLELGNGLTGMSERVEHRGGEIRFDPGAGRGFGVTARIPAS
jgi:hypothetical protein